MVTSEETSSYEPTAAKVPDCSGDDWGAAHVDHNESEAFLQSSHPMPSSKQSRHTPSTSRLRRHNFSSANSPRLYHSTLRQLKLGDDFLTQQSLFLAPPSLSRNNSKHNLRPSLSRKSSRKLHRRNKSKDVIDAKAYNSEAEFLIQNQHQFTTEDFQAVLAALAEESRIQDELMRQEEESILLAQELASEDLEMSAPASASPSDGMEALVVALVAEIDESNSQREDEKNSYHLACRLVAEDARASGVLEGVHREDAEEERGESLWKCEGGQSHASFFQLQCQACHLDIENEEEIRNLPCSHHFHAHCINRWFLMNKKDCPYCRQQVC